MLNKTFTAALITENKKGAWTYLIWPESVAALGTGKAVKVKGTIDGIEFLTSFLPMGDGTHMLPIKAAILKAIKKGAGDEVEVVLMERV